MGIHFVLLISRQGKVRLTKWYSAMPAKDRARAVREASALVLSRQQKQCNFIVYKDKKIIYKRYFHTTRKLHTAHTFTFDLDSATTTNSKKKDEVQFLT